MRKGPSRILDMIRMQRLGGIWECTMIVNLGVIIVGLARTAPRRQPLRGITNTGNQVVVAVVAETNVVESYFGQR